MSYKKKKQKKSRLNQFKYKLGLVKLALLKKARALLQKEGRMRLPQVARIMESLRLRNKSIRPNNQKIDEWVDNYIQQCILKGQKVDILTQWCLSKDLEPRYQARPQKFIPTKAERYLFEKEIPEILSKFSENGIGLNWWVTLNRSYLDSGRLSLAIENEYRSMLEELIKVNALTNVTLWNWEDDILNSRPGPALNILNNISDFISAKAFKIELDRHSAWALEEAKLTQTREELKRDVEFQIACEAEEGRFLFSADSPFPCGQFVLVPLEFPERYVFFSVLAPEFKKRIVSAVKSYPWRMDADSLSYEL